MIHRSTALALFVPFIVACATPVTDPTEERDGESDRLVGLVEVSNNAGTARLFDGYTSVIKSESPSCVVAKDPPRVVVGDLKETYTLLLVSSREELARQLGIDLGADLKLSRGFANPKLELLRTYARTERSVFLLLAAKQSYDVANRDVVELAPVEKQLLVDDPTGFLATCGSHYVSSIRYGAELFVAIRFDAVDAETSQKVKASLGFGAEVPMLSAKGDVGAKLDEVSKLAGVSMTLQVATEGFLVGESPAGADTVAALLGEKITGETIQKIDAVRALMGKSIEVDRCRDAGLASCEGPGYVENGSRSASPATLTLTPYSATRGAPRARNGWNGYAEIRERLERVDATLAALSQVQLEMESVYRDDLLPFLEAPPATQVTYGFAPPSLPAYRIDEMRGIGGQYAGMFRSDDGMSAGTRVRPVVDRLDECLSDASVGAFETCDFEAYGGPEALPEVVEARAALTSYGEVGRILPLEMKLVPQAVTYPYAKSLCESYTLRGLPMRLPDREEARRLAIPVGYLVATKTASVPHAVWHAGDSACRSNAIDSWAAFENDPQGTPTVDRCVSWLTGVLPAICVPSTGVFEDRPLP